MGFLLFLFFFHFFLFLNCLSQVCSLLLHIFPFLSVFSSPWQVIMAQPTQHSCHPAPSTGITAARAPAPWVTLENRWREQKMTASVVQRLQLIIWLDLTEVHGLFYRMWITCQHCSSYYLSCTASEYLRIFQNIPTCFSSYLHQTKVNADHQPNLTAQRATQPKDLWLKGYYMGKINWCKPFLVFTTDHEHQFGQ